MLTERRRQPRLDVRGKFWICPLGSQTQISVDLEDLSDCGAGVVSTNSLETGSFVMLLVSPPEISGRARVRYCNREHNRYRAGLEFGPPNLG